MHAADRLSDPNTAVQPNPALLGEAVGFYLVTRTCSNADATFATHGSCVTPIETSQFTLCQVSSGFYVKSMKSLSHVYAEWSLHDQPCMQQWHGLLVL
jgi:hypothetical protein